MKYKIVRMYFKSQSRVIERGLTLEEAQQHCGNPEPSSTTCTSTAGKRRPRSKGQWFDGYE